MAHFLGSVMWASLASIASAAAPQRPVAGADPEVAQRTARADAQLAAAAQHLEEAAAAIAESGRAASLLTGARERLADARRELVAMPERGLAIDAAGVEFAMEDDTATPVPGSQGWLEVAAGKLTGNGPRLALRVFGSDVVVPSRPLAVGESLSFKFRDQVHELVCVAVRDGPRFITSHDLITLRVRTSSGAAADAEVPAATVPAQPAERPVAIVLLAWIEARVGASEAERGRAEQALGRGDAAAARAAIAAARARAQEATTALAHVQRLATAKAPWQIGDLALVRGRVTRVLPLTPPVDLAGLEPRERAAIGGLQLLGRVVGGALGMVRLEVRIDEVQAAGRRYASLTRRGKAAPELRRTDVAVGATLVLENSRPDTGVAPLAAGEHCWLALSPPLAHKALPRAAGTGDHVTIVFALPVVDER